MRAAAKMQSAGLLLFRLRNQDVEVLLAHPGGPFWRNKDHGAWTIPKGLIEAGETPISAAQREFAEETGHLPAGEPISLDNARQSGGKLVHVWAIQNDWDPQTFAAIPLRWNGRLGLNNGNRFRRSTEQLGSTLPKLG